MVSFEVISATTFSLVSLADNLAGQYGWNNVMDYSHTRMSDDARFLCYCAFQLWDQLCPIYDVSGKDVNMRFRNVTRSSPC
jgi:hypothetical protein